MLLVYVSFIQSGSNTVMPSRHVVVSRLAICIVLTWKQSPPDSWYLKTKKGITVWMMIFFRPLLQQETPTSALFVPKWQKANGSWKTLRCRFRKLSLLPLFSRKTRRPNLLPQLPFDKENDNRKQQNLALNCYLYCWQVKTVTLLKCSLLSVAILCSYRPRIYCRPLGNEVQKIWATLRILFT